MKSRLKNLCKYLIEHGKQEFKDWHDTYREFYDQIRQIRKHVKAGERLLESNHVFLRQLLYDKPNEINSCARSVVNSGTFQPFVNPEPHIHAGTIHPDSCKLHSAVGYSFI